MKARIAGLVGALRDAGLAVSLAEAMDAARAAAVAGVERPVLREALAATLVKSEDDRAIFLDAFDRVFPADAGAVARVARGKRPRRAGARGDGGGTPMGGAGSPGGGAASGGAARAGGARAPSPDASADPNAPAPSRRAGSGESSEPALSARAAERARDAAADGDESRRGEAGSSDPAAERDQTSEREGASPERERARRTRALVQLPFRAMTPADVEACAALVAAIAARVTGRVRRRLAPKKTGRLDFRRTIRAAVPHAGVPFERRYRGRRPDRPALVALCDLSASAAVATDFFLALLAPATAYFRRVRLFGYVDRLVEIEFAAGQVRPAAPIVLMARSDFGRVLGDLDAVAAGVLGADTVLLVLGDARNNRRPPRADLLAAARARVRRLVWLNPEPRPRWDTGDSVIGIYARHADLVVPCGTFAELEPALAEVVARLPG